MSDPVFPPAIHRSIEHNAHAVYYQSIHEHLTDYPRGLSEEHIAECEAAGECWALQWYPDTPIGFYVVIAPTFSLMLERAWAVHNSK